MSRRSYLSFSVPGSHPFNCCGIRPSNSHSKPIYKSLTGNNLIMGDASVFSMPNAPAFVVPTAEKRFNTELTDYSRRHEDNTGPYADNLDLDAIIVGAGFSECFWRMPMTPFLSRQRTYAPISFSRQVEFSCSRRYENVDSARSFSRLAMISAGVGGSTAIQVLVLTRRSRNMNTRGQKCTSRGLGRPTT